MSWKWGKQLLLFGYEEAMSCVFPACIFISLALLKITPLPGMPVYDWMLVICIAVQIIMVRAGLETIDELKVICVFHLIGLALELYKVHMGSWDYPQPGWTKIGGVPLYSGFMYASVASYLCQAWRRLHIRLNRWPSSVWTVTLGAAIYLNFMTHHFIPDLRWLLAALLFVLFFRTTLYFKVGDIVYRMPLTLGFALVGFFIWIAENIGTWLGAWRYPHQQEGWSMVSWSKFSSWFLLVIVSFIIVAQLKHVKELRPKKNTADASVRPNG